MWITSPCSGWNVFGPSPTERALISPEPLPGGSVPAFPYDGCSQFLEGAGCTVDGVRKARRDETVKESSQKRKAVPIPVPCEDGRVPNVAARWAAGCLLYTSPSPR